ncbi:MAG: hypothetical protein ABIK84_03720 [candidate division WOR-3 bacterium]
MAGNSQGGYYEVPTYLILLAGGIIFLFAQNPRQDEPMEPIYPIPSNAQISTDFKKVTIDQPPMPLYELRCYTHAYGWWQGNIYYLARACSTSAWNPITNEPMTIYYIDVYGPYCYQQLLLPNFNVVLASDPISQQFNAHRAGLYKDHHWTPGENRIMRALSSHMGYGINYPGGRITDVPTTFQFKCGPNNEVTGP